MFAAFAALIAFGVTGCGKSNRDRFSESMAQVITDSDEIKKEMERFDKMDKDEQCKTADYAEYFALLKKASGGALGMREIKKTVSKQFEGMSAEQRSEFLKKCRKEMGVK